MLIKLNNVQSIKEAVYDLGDHGIVQIKGDNSNGKSIIIKAIGSIVNLEIMDEEERCALISDFAESSMITMQYNGRVLATKLTRERNGCVMMLVRENGDKIKRTFRDGGLKELISEFGFCCYNGNSICLQLQETFGPMPFVNTTPKVNGEIVESITEDTVAKAFLKNYKEVTYPRAKEQIKQLKEKVASLERVKESLMLFDYTQYEDYATKLEKLYNALKYLEPLELPRINMPPRFEYVDLPKLELTKMNMPLRVPLVDLPKLSLPRLTMPPRVRMIDLPKLELPNVSYMIKELEELRKGKCPTCGRTLEDI